ncbi:MAG: hypothetical protein ACYTKD_14345 [Planctomycetota bacterium]|jgi:hypothetical protein
MKKIEPAFLASVLLGLAAGCAQIDPSEVVYGAPQRVGITHVSYGPAMSVSDTWPAYLIAGRGQLGFDSSSGAEISYALPLKPGFDLKMAVDVASWDVKFDENWIPAGDEATWSQTGIMLLLRGGWKWGRFGMHFGAGPGWLINDLEWPAHTTTTDGSFALQAEIGATVAIHPSFDLEFDLGYRVSRATYAWDGNGREQILNTVLGKVGIAFMF